LIFDSSSLLNTIIESQTRSAAHGNTEKNAARQIDVADAIMQNLKLRRFER
jgi:hypothetical protein